MAKRFGIISPWAKCLCGGKYRIIDTGEESETACSIEHTMPKCKEYENITTVSDAVKFSEKNRFIDQN